MKTALMILTLAGGMLASPGLALDLFSASGDWVGMGSIATTVERPMQPARCQVGIDPRQTGKDVSVTGRCVVSLGASDVSFRFLRGAGGQVSAAVWAAATGEILQFRGAERAGGVEMAATAPWVVEGQAYETRLTLLEPDVSSFTVRQLVRAPGETNWRVIVDMTYRQN